VMPSVVMIRDNPGRSGSTHSSTHRLRSAGLANRPDVK
jgi:hypothetical protein